MTLWNNSEWKGPQEVSSPTCCSKWDLHQGQTRTLFIQVLSPPKTKVCQSLCPCSSARLSSPERTFSLGQVTPAPLQFVSDVLLCASVHRPLCRSRRSAVSSPKPFLLQSGPPHLPQPLFTQLCPSEHLGSPPLNPLCFISACHVLGVPKTACGVSSGSEKCRVPGSHGFPGSRWLCCCWYSPVLLPCVVFLVQGCICTHMLTTDVSHPPATQLCKEPHSSAHIYMCRYTHVSDHITCSTEQ